MRWIEQSLPPEADDPPPEPMAAPKPAPAPPLDAVEAERAELRSKILPRLRTARQVRIRERITALTIESLKLRRTS